MCQADAREQKMDDFTGLIGPAGLLQLSAGERLASRQQEEP
jgi:hypothetical protein